MQGICLKICIKILAFIFCVIALPTLTVAQDTTSGIIWESPIQISPDSVRTWTPRVAGQGDTIHITWTNNMLQYPYVRSVNEGASFEPMRKLAPDSVGYVSPNWIFTSRGKIHTIFTATKTGGFPFFNYHMISSDNGDTWSSPVRFDDTLIYYASTSLGDTVVLRSSKPGQFFLLTKSTDGGITWNSETCNMLNGNGQQIALTKNYLHLVKGSGFDSGGVWYEYVAQYRKSSDLGQTWSDSIPLSTVGYTHGSVPIIATDTWNDTTRIFTAWWDNKYGCSTMVGCSILGRISDDEGFTFAPEIRFDERPAGCDADAAMHNNVMAIVWNDDLPDGGLMIRTSIDEGNNWSPPFMLSYGGTHDVAITNNAIHVVYSELILQPDSTYRFKVFYRRGLFLKTSVKEVQNIPLDFMLKQNYPNPFNPSTKLLFVISHSSLVSVKVYDVFGREVAMLVNEKKQPGEYSIEWSAEGFANGVYFVRMVAGEYVSTIKTILMK
jgi:hypothetical protein